MVREELILNPKGRLANITIIPLAITINVFIGIYFFGYNGRLAPSIPVTALNYISPFGIPIVIAVWLLSIYVIFFWRLKDVQSQKTITIDDKIIAIHDSNNKIYYQLNKTKRISVTISKIWAVLYSHSYYRVGIVKFKYGNDRFVFYFPIRNQDIEAEVKSLSKFLG